MNFSSSYMDKKINHSSTSKHEIIYFETWWRWQYWIAPNKSQTFKFWDNNVLLQLNIHSIEVNVLIYFLFIFIYLFIYSFIYLFVLYVAYVCDLFWCYLLLDFTTHSLHFSFWICQPLVMAGQSICHFLSTISVFLCYLWNHCMQKGNLCQYHKAYDFAKI